tara:strand:- start:3884 stop:5116 length:1233 start_codon:yes stop_codon:yes gene_type:complete
MAKRWETDPEVAGLCISRGQSFVFRYGLNGGQWDRQIKLGDVGEMKLKEARNRALECRLLVMQGKDPRVALGRGETYKTLVDLAHDFIELHAKPNKRSWKNDESYFRLHLLKAPFATWRLADIDQGVLWHWHATHKNKITANRCLETLSKAFNLAKCWGWLPKGHENPCEGITHHHEKSRRRYASAEEVDRLLRELRAKKAAGGIHFRFACMIQLLMLTGARLNEIMSARWSEVDLVEGVITPHRHKRDSTEHREVVLGTDALRVVMELRDHEPPGEWLIRGRGKNHLAEHHKPWSRLKEAAEVRDLWVHDLRHTFASYLISSGHTLGVIGELLGHASQQTTRRYSHLMKRERRRAVDQAAAYLRAPRSQLGDLHTTAPSADPQRLLLTSSATGIESRWPCSEPPCPPGH